MDFSDHKMHRRIMQSAFKNDRLESYMPEIHEVVRKHVALWQQSGEIAFVNAVKDCLLEVGSRVFLGLELGADADRINEHFVNMVKACSTPVRLNIPGTQFNKGIKGYHYISDYFRSHNEGARQSDATDTTTLSTMMYEFMRHPDWIAKCHQEVAAPDCDTLSYGQLSDLDTLSWCFKETLRLYPPVNAVARRNLREFEFMGHTIPANSMVVVPNLLIMRMAEFFTNADEFDPGRFGPERAEHKRHSFAWSPFGGGAHKSIGLHFAEMLVKVTLFELLRSSEVKSTSELVSTEGGFNYVPFPKPRDDLPVRVSRR